MTSPEDTYVADLADEIADRLADRLDVRPLLTVAQAGERLALSERTVFTLIKDGAIRTIRVGTGKGNTRIEQREIDRYLAGQRAAGERANGENIGGPK
jgi:excisionase family DNA binding protein